MALQRACAESGWTAAVMLRSADRPGALAAESVGPAPIVAVLRVLAEDMWPRVEPSSDARAIVAPMRASGAMVGVLAVAPTGGIRPFDVALVGAVADRLGAAIESDRLRHELRERSSQADLMQQQLQAYAVDVREAFLSEKARAEELAGALDRLEQTFIGVVQGLAIAVEAKDAATGGHLVRVARYGKSVIELIAPERADDPQLNFGFLLHDIGKLSVPDAILCKRGPLTEQEWAVMRRHPIEGCRILEGIPSLAEARAIVAAHHERWDGAGYPHGLRGEEIPFGARIFPVVDAFDAMVSERPYRPGLGVDEALRRLRAGAGSQWWADAVEAFFEVPLDELEHVRSLKAVAS